jgi:hypothetical protein
LAINRRQQEDQDVPEDAVTQLADRGEQVTNDAPLLAASVQTQAPRVFVRIDPAKYSIDSCGSHGYSSDQKWPRPF